MRGQNAEQILYGQTNTRIHDNRHQPLTDYSAEELVELLTKEDLEQKEVITRVFVKGDDKRVTEKVSFSAFINYFPDLATSRERAIDLLEDDMVIENTTDYYQEFSLRDDEQRQILRGQILLAIEDFPNTFVELKNWIK